MVGSPFAVTRDRVLKPLLAIRGSRVATEEKDHCTSISSISKTSEAYGGIGPLRTAP
jgi:hypothetical protein